VCFAHSLKRLHDAVGQCRAVRPVEFLYVPGHSDLPGGCVMNERSLINPGNTEADRLAVLGSLASKK
jgi:hypothetical protein